MESLSPCHYYDQIIIGPNATDQISWTGETVDPATATERVLHGKQVLHDFDETLLMESNALSTTRPSYIGESNNGFP